MMDSRIKANLTKSTLWGLARLWRARLEGYICGMIFSLGAILRAVFVTSV